MNWLKEMFAKIGPTWKRWGASALLVTVTAIITYLVTGKTPAPVIPPLPDVPIWEQPPDGWVEDKEAVQFVVAQLPFAVFADTPCGRGVDPLPDHVYMWQAYWTATGSPPASKNQGQVGSCVSFGTNNAIERTMMVEVAQGKPVIFKRLCEEATYGGSRVEIGGGRINGDGSVGAWAAKFVQKYGVVSREVHGVYDLSNYDQRRCREWGQAGVPDDLEPTLKEHPVQEITLVKTWASAKRALASGYGIAVCSDQGFSMQRDNRGIAAPRGSWAHCMCLDGYHVDADGKEYGHIENSWGETAHTGPVGWGNPPTSGFWADAKTVERMLGQGDSWAFSAVKGFPARRIDWSARAEPIRPFRPLQLFTPERAYAAAY